MRLTLAVPFLLALMPLKTSGEGEGLLNKLLAPGPLIEGHKDLELSGCLQCHDSGKGVPNSKCLECHKDIRKQIDQAHGYHGMMVDSCIHCHRDHKGRVFDTAVVNEKEFDHKKAGFPLEGKHQKIKCSECHTEKRGPKKLRPKDIRYFGSAATCVSCHKKDDPHYFKSKWAQKDCGVCHGVRTWNSEVRFDHGKDTGFELEGAHDELDCAKCHAVDKKAKTALYSWPKLKLQQCLTCHQDVHKSNLSSKFQGGARCTKCHTQDDWKIEKFDHKVTDYPLRGKHAEITCVKCHIQKANIAKKEQKHYVWKGLSPACLTCHSDYHIYGKLKLKGFGELNKCERCHNESDWKHVEKFDHNIHTRYGLDGKHLDVSCNECHIPGFKKDNPVGNKLLKVSRYQWPQLTSKTCETCHKSPHKNEFSPAMLAKKCTECHTTEGWKLDKNRKDFKHTETRFPLTGKHTQVSCKECHEVNKKQVFRFSSKDLKFCIDCHKTPHTEQFDKKFNSQSCAECHSTERWEKQLKFDHNQTSFKLRDAHAKLNCVDCHKETDKRFDNKTKSAMHQFVFTDLTKKGCVTCHADYHVGQLGSNCARCHSEKSWKTTSFDHNVDSQYPLKDKHKTVKCADCHRTAANRYVVFASKKMPVILYKPVSTRCGDCHRDPHKGTLGTGCADCHSERGWKVTKNFHENFTLHGTHYTLSCAECHKEGRKLSGLSENCIICHQKDDVHSGSLPKCSECHRQQVWEQTSFRHSMTFFPLRGAHRTLDCAECHANGIYRGTPYQCLDCHRNNAQQVTSPVHSMPAFSNCKGCHNQFTFQL